MLNELLMAATLTWPRVNFGCNRFWTASWIVGNGLGVFRNDWLFQWIGLEQIGSRNFGVIKCQNGAAGQEWGKMNVFSISNYFRLINSSSMEHWNQEGPFWRERERERKRALKFHTCSFLFILYCIETDRKDAGATYNMTKCGINCYEMEFELRNCGGCCGLAVLRWPELRGRCHGGDQSGARYLV